MNERIKELWDKAAESTAAYPSGQNNSWETQVNFMEKFAELIVGECIRSVEDVPGRVTRDYDWLVKQTKIHAIEKIKDKFGVES